MKEITIKPVTTRKELRRFVRFNWEMYKDCEYAVPDLLEDTMDMFDPKKNPALDFCECECFIAEQDGNMVGRVAAIINRSANERWGKKEVRFGWIDFVDDINVTRTLLETVEQWGKIRGMDTIVGPLGFTDMDLEGMLIEGFDQLSTMNSIYNFPYYPEHMKQLGYTVETTWVERKVWAPKNGREAQSQTYVRVAEMVRKRYGFRIHEFKNKKEIRTGGYIQKVFALVNRSYAKLYGYSDLTEKQMETYAKTYLNFLDKRYLAVVETPEGKVIGMGVCITSLSRAIQKAKAKLFPFGWWHLAKALWFNKHPQVLDMLLIGVDPDYHNKGVHALLFDHIMPEALKDGYVWAETHHQLEDNTQATAVWKNLDCHIHKRRVAFTKPINR